MFVCVKGDFKLGPGKIIIVDLINEKIAANHPPFHPCLNEY